MLPICDICAKTGVLCGACETKLEKGEITPLDVELSGVLYNLGAGEIGFEKAIVLLEEDCEEFSNIEGLGQIRFPKGKISAIFEDIRQILGREGLVDKD